MGSLGLGFLLVFTGTLRTGVRDQDSHSLSFESKQPEVPVFSRKRIGFTGTFVFYETGISESPEKQVRVSTLFI